MPYWKYIKNASNKTNFVTSIHASGVRAINQLHHPYTQRTVLVSSMPYWKYIKNASNKTNFVTSIHASGAGAINQLHHPLDTRYRTTGAGSESRLWESGLGSGTDACGYPIL